MTRICLLPYVKDVILQGQSPSKMEVRCHTNIERKTLRFEVCEGCNREKGTGHAGPECVVGGNVKYTSGSRTGDYCENRHPNLPPV